MRPIAGRPFRNTSRTDVVRDRGDAGSDENFVLTTAAVTKSRRTRGRHEVVPMDLAAGLTHHETNARARLRNSATIF